MPLTLKHVARGIGGVNEMSLHLDESKVLYGVLRLVFGKGTFARTKYVACHFNGGEVSCDVRTWTMEKKLSLFRA